MNRDELLAAMASTAARHKSRRGRPPAGSIADLETGMRRFAIEVFVDEHARGRRRGDLTKATLAVAVRHGLNDQTLRKAVQRHRDLREVADLYAELDREEKDWMELRQRMRGFPAAVRRWLAPLPAAAVLAVLRVEDVNGDCPDWLNDAARGDLMSPK